MLTILAAVLCVVTVGVQLPRFIGPEKAGVPSVAVRVVTANLGFGRALSSADVLVIQELTPEAVEGLSSAGLDQTFPHTVLNPVFTVADDTASAVAAVTAASRGCASS